MTIRQKVAVWCVAVPLVLAGAAFARSALAAVAASHKPAPVDPPPVAVKTARLAPETLTRAIRYSGSVKEWQKSDLSFRVAGTVESLRRVARPGGGDRDLHEGDVFPRGTVLARLDPADYRLERAAAAEKLAQAEAKLASARADADNARADSDRFQALASTGSASATETDTTRTKSVTTEAAARAAAREADGARVQLAQADANLGYCTLAMPFESGTLAARTVETAERVTAGQKAFQVIDLTSVRIAFGVSDAVVGRLAIGGAVGVTSDALPDDRFGAVITKIAPTADAQSRTYLVEVRVAEPRGLRPGMVATATIGADRTATLLPLVAVTREVAGGRLVAYKVARDGGRTVAKLCPVELDGVVDNRAAIRPDTPGGLRPGDEVVVAGAPRLFDGAAVQVIGEVSTASEGAR